MVSAWDVDRIIAAREGDLDHAQVSDRGRDPVALEARCAPGYRGSARLEAANGLPIVHVSDEGQGELVDGAIRSGGRVSSSPPPPKWMQGELRRRAETGISPCPQWVQIESPRVRIQRVPCDWKQPGFPLKTRELRSNRLDSVVVAGAPTSSRGRRFKSCPRYQRSRPDIVWPRSAFGAYSPAFARRLRRERSEPRDRGRRLAIARFVPGALGGARSTSVRGPTKSAVRRA